MNEQEYPPVSPAFEAALRAYYADPAPRPAFVAQLEQELRARHPDAAATAPLSQRIVAALGLRRARGWQLVTLALLLLAILALFAIGPRRVLAEAQRLLGYVPGMGFVDLDQARVLAAPAAVSQDGVRLQIDELLAEPDQTRLRFSVQGLIATAEIAESGPDTDLEAHLLLPDGTRLRATGWEFNTGAFTGELKFPALPQGISELTLTLDRLPFDVQGDAPQVWQLPLKLRPGSGEPSEELFPQPYTPAIDPVALKGVTVRLLQVAQGPTETGLLVEFAWEDPEWRWESSPSAALRDDLGHEYLFPSASGASVAVEEAIVVTEQAAGEPPAPTPDVRSQIHTDTFAPLSLAAREGIFTVESLGFSVPFDQGFTLDLGEDPQVGQAWQLDRRLEAGDYHLDFLTARLIAAPEAIDSSETGEPYQLLLTLRGEGPQDVQINFADLEVGHPDLRGTGAQGDPQSGEMQVELTFVAKPEGEIRIQVPRIQISLLGPWELRWTLPNAPASEGAVRRVSPEGAQGAHHRVTLQVDEAIFSDRVSAVHLRAPGLPAGVLLQQILAGDPWAEAFPFFLYPDQDPDLYLEDQWARRLGQPGDVRWYPPGEAGSGDPGWLTFAPAEPLTQGLNLHVPAVALSEPAGGTMQIAIPGGLSFHEEEYALPERLRELPGAPQTATRRVTEPWAIDLDLEIGGYALHFDQAQVHHLGSAPDPLYQLVLSGPPQEPVQDGWRLNQAHFSRVSRPDGPVEETNDPLEAGAPYGLPLTGWMGFSQAEEGRLSAYLFPDLAGDSGLDLLPGEYRFTFDALSVYVPGPWDLSWSLIP